MLGYAVECRDRVWKDERDRMWKDELALRWEREMEREEERLRREAGRAELVV